MSVKSALSIDKKTTKIAVLYGGLSSEREVSLRSGKNCYDALKRLGYERAELIDVDTDLASTLRKGGFEVAFLCLHGKYGEDGTVQGLLELLKIPYTGSGVLASALAMNKTLTKQILKAGGLPYPETILVEPNEIKNFAELRKRLPDPPVMIKPHKEGSSVGVSKASDEAELESQLKSTVIEYGGALVERYIKGQEITVGVIERQNGNGKKFTPLPILELRPKSKAGFYDYEAKYTKGMTEFILPAEIPENTAIVAQKLAVETFRALSCSGYGRVDMMVDEKGNPYILELNSLPGMTDTSDLPAMAEQAGIGYDELVEIILMSAGLDK